MMNTAPTTTPAARTFDFSRDFAEAIADYLRSLSPRARTRTVDVGDVVWAFEEHAKVIAANPDTIVRTRLVGGFVANSYIGKADADRVEIETDASGRTTYSVSRTWAEKRAYGKGDEIRTWLVTAAGGLKRAA